MEKVMDTHAYAMSCWIALTGALIKARVIESEDIASMLREAAAARRDEGTSTSGEVAGALEVLASKLVEHDPCQPHA
jgi:hypothetical protein